jgi:ubiquinone/menaquinone biosynthesis C-methylase UbiE
MEENKGMEQNQAQGNNQGEQQTKGERQSQGGGERQEQGKAVQAQTSQETNKTPEFTAQNTAQPASSADQAPAISNQEQRRPDYRRSKHRGHRGGRNRNKIQGGEQRQGGRGEQRQGARQVGRQGQGQTQRQGNAAQVTGNNQNRSQESGIRNNNMDRFDRNQGSRGKFSEDSRQQVRVQGGAGPESYRRYGEIRPLTTRPVESNSRPGNTADLQRNLYDGRDMEYRPIYQDLQFFRNYMEEHIIAARDKGIFGYSLKAIRNEIELKKLNLKNFEHVLDAGCGPGILINQLKSKYGVKGYGVDISSFALSRARDCGNRKIEFRQGKLERLPFPNRYFDVVVSFDVLEHVEDKNRSLKEIYRVLRPNARALMYAVSKKDLFTWHWFLRMISFGRLGKDTQGGHFRENFAVPKEVARTLKELGAKKVVIKYFHSFFTLLLDELLIAILSKSGANRPVYISGALENAGVQGKVPGKKLFAHRVLSIIYPIAEFLDIPWKLFGLSNGFFIYFEKGGDNAGR